MIPVSNTAAALPDVVIALRRDFLQSPYLLKEETPWEEGDGAPDECFCDDSELEARLAACVREERR